MKNQILGTAFLATALSLVGCDAQEKTSSASDNISNNINGVLDGYYLDDNYNGDGYLNNNSNPDYYGYNNGYVIDPYYKDYNDSNGYSYSYPNYNSNSDSYSNAENYKYKNYMDNTFTFDDDNYNNYDGFIASNYDMLYNGDGGNSTNNSTTSSNSTTSTTSTTSTPSTVEEPTSITTNNTSINNNYHTSTSSENYSERFGWGMKGAENIAGNQIRDYSMMDVIKN